MHPISKKLCAVYNQLQKEGHIAFPLESRNILDVDTIVKTVRKH